MREPIPYLPTTAEATLGRYFIQDSKLGVHPWTAALCIFGVETVDRSRLHYRGGDRRGRKGKSSPVYIETEVQ